MTATAGDGQASVSFAPPASDGGAAITSYTVTSSPDGKTATGPGSPLVVTGLTNGTSYTFTVTAHNLAGDSAPSAASAAVTPPDRARGADRRVRSGPDGQASVSFTAPASDGGAAITLVHGHLVARREDRDGREQPARRDRADERRELHVHGDGAQRGR